MTIHYLTYCSNESDANLDVSPAAQQKSSYLTRLIDLTGENYRIINLAESNKKIGLNHKIEKEVGERGTYVRWMTFGKPCRLFSKIHYYFRKVQLERYLNKLDCTDVVIAYHSLSTCDIYTKTSHKRRFKFILELEEVYQDVVSCGKYKAVLEKKCIASADGYILATESLAKQIPEGKPYIVINGTYRSEWPRNVSFGDNKIHCIYAGTFDPTKGGAAAAAAAAEFLPENYHVHILGFGTEEQKKQLQELIALVQERTKCTLTYDGLKSGEEYIQFLQKCHIGLCTQIPDAKYTETSFPSKVLVYLANGLRVLSVRIPAVEQSDIGDLLFYYDEQKPEKIAEAIQNIDVTLPYDSRKRLKQMDKCAENNLNELIRKLSQ